MKTVDVHAALDGVITAEYRENWHPQKRRKGAVACRFVVLYAGRWRRLWADKSRGVPHYIRGPGDTVLSVSRVPV